jgi:hypothetical protein
VPFKKLLKNDKLLIFVLASPRQNVEIALRLLLGLGGSELVVEM